MGVLLINKICGGLVKNKEQYLQGLFVELVCASGFQDWFIWMVLDFI